MSEEKMIPDELVFPGVDGMGAVGVEGVGAGDDVAGFILASQVQRSSLRWTEPMSAFVLRQMCH
jgi:hypothetical protein